MSRFTMKLLCAVVVVAFSSACGSPEAAKPGITLQKLVDDLVNDAKANGGVAQEVGPDGGTVIDSATGAAVEIPAGALPQADAGDTFVVSIVPYTGAKLKSPEGFTLAGPLFEIGIESVREKTSVQPLSAVRITVPYTDDAAGLAVGNYHAGAWVTKPTEAIDEKASLVTASFTQMSPFAALRTVGNTAPEADVQAVATAEDTALLGTLTGTDADGDLLSYALAPGSDVQHGTLVLQISGDFTYTPAANYNGSDQFSFVVNDGTVDSQVAVVTITVNPGNDAPTLNGLALNTLANKAVSATLVGSDVDSDALNYSVSTAPAHGSVAITASTGALFYTPTTNYTGNDVFYVRAHDGTAYSAPVSVTVKVNPILRYVKPSATGSGDGTSWANATAGLQAAINDVFAGGAGEVWIAKGTYRSSGTGTLVTMKNNVDVYGGFAGTETARADRGAVVDSSATVLTGDTDSSGTFTTGDAYHVVQGANARLDGVTITGGNAVGAGSLAMGGGMYNSALMKLSNVHIYRNHANTDGGGIYSTQNLLIQNARIEDNTASAGGGVESYNSTLTVENTAVIGNTASNSGGGLYVGFGNLSFSHGIVDGNSASQSGGGIFVSNSPTTVFNSQISHNSTTTWRGGGLIANGAYALVVTHTLFVGNSAGTAGGGLALMSSPPLTLRNSSFWGNTAPSGKDILSPPALSVYNTCSETNLSTYGSANSTATTSPFVTPAASGEYFFDPAHGCSNWGNAATATTRFSTTDTAWENWTSEISGTGLEGSTAGVAAGMLHHPEDAWIRSFDVAAGSLTWQTNAGAEYCSISNNANTDVVQVGAADLPSGTQGHSLTSGTLVTFSCRSARSFPKSVTGTVP